MEKYRVFIKPSAVEELKAIRVKKIRQRIVRNIAGLADDARPSGCQKLSGQEKFRLRQGRYRIVYEVNDKERMVHVVKIGHRRDVYRDH